MPTVSDVDDIGIHNLNKILHEWYDNEFVPSTGCTGDSLSGRDPSLQDNSEKRIINSLAKDFDHEVQGTSYRPGLC